MESSESGRNQLKEGEAGTQRRKREKGGSESWQEGNVKEMGGSHGKQEGRKKMDNREFEQAGRKEGG